MKTIGNWARKLLTRITRPAVQPKPATAQPRRTSRRR